MQPEEYDKMYALEDQHWWFAAKRLFAQVFLKQLSGRKRKILDVGCGTGRNMVMLKEWGQVSGADVNDLALKYCRRRGLLQVKKASAESLPFKGGKFDLVTIFDVLYHRGIKNDLVVLKEVYRVTKPGGYLLVTDCAHPWLFGPHDVAMQARQRYSKQELKAKIIKAGFSVRRASFIFMSTFPLFLINRLLKKYFRGGSQSDVSALPKWLNTFLLTLNRLESKLLNYFNLPIGSSIIVWAQKP